MTCIWHVIGTLRFHHTQHYLLTVLYGSAGSCEHGNELRGFTETEEFLY